MRVAAYTGGPNVPSARARVRQYIAPLGELGIHVSEYPLPWGNVLPRSRALRPLWAGATAISRALDLARSWTADLTWVSRQLLPAFAPVHALARQPMVLDVDDAIWLNTGGHRAKNLAQASAAVVCGNAYLADYFRQWNAAVHVIPTAIDAHKYSPRPAVAEDDPVIVGWSGTSGNFDFLYDIEEALARVLEERPAVRLRIVADRAPAFARISAARVEFIRWQPGIEADSMREMSIGLMPLADNAWCAGKCSFKMLCSMACALPVVVSPVGMNRDVLSCGNVGFGATRTQEWIDALLLLIDNPELRSRMGAAGRTVVEQHFSLERLVPRYAEVLHGVVRAAKTSPIAEAA
jgi:glycosyltransferase involved in cell wall biosynthesis